MICNRESPTWFAPGPILAKNFRRDHDVLALGPQRLADHGLGLAHRVDVGGVDEIHSGVERVLYQRVDIMLRQAADYFEDAPFAAKRHCAQAKARNKNSGVAQLLILHATILRPGPRTRVTTLIRCSHAHTRCRFNSDRACFGLRRRKLGRPLEVSRGGGCSR
jgi:hypothetical protein